MRQTRQSVRRDGRTGLHTVRAHRRSPLPGGGKLTTWPGGHVRGRPLGRNLLPVSGAREPRRSGAWPVSPLEPPAQERKARLINDPRVEDEVGPEGEPSSPTAPSRDPLLDLYSRDAVCGHLATAPRGGAGLTVGLMPQGRRWSQEADDDPRVRTSFRAGLRPGRASRRLCGRRTGLILP